MTHEHKIGIGITCTFLCLTGAVIGLKMRNQPMPNTASETVPEVEETTGKAPGNQARGPFVPSLDGIKKSSQEPVPESPDSKKGPMVSPGLAPFNPGLVTGKTNPKDAEKNSLSKNGQTPPANGTGPSSAKASTTETKNNDGKNSREEISWPPLANTSTNTLTRNQSSTSSQQGGGVAQMMGNSETSKPVNPPPNPEDYFTKAIPVPTMPDTIPESQKGTGSVRPGVPSTSVAGPAIFAPLSPSPSPPPPPPPMPSFGTGATPQPSTLRPGETAPSPPPKQEPAPFTNVLSENKSASSASQPPLANKTDNSKPAPLIPTSASPAPTPLPSGSKPPDGSYFIQDPHSITNAANGTATENGDKSRGSVPAPLPLPPLPNGTEPGRTTTPGSGQAGGNPSASASSTRPAPQVIVYDEIDYVCKPGDTFAKISARWYQTEAFAEALKRHNQHHARASEQMAKFGTITAGEKIVIPPADILEQRYGDALVKPNSPPANPTVPASYNTPAPPPSGGSLSPPQPR